MRSTNCASGIALPAVGCIAYYLHEAAGADGMPQYVFYEIWRSVEDYQQHLRTPLIAAFEARQPELLRQPVEIEWLRPL